MQWTIILILKEIMQLKEEWLCLLLNYLVLSLSLLAILILVHWYLQSFDSIKV